MQLYHDTTAFSSEREALCRLQGVGDYLVSIHRTTHLSTDLLRFRCPPLRMSATFEIESQHTQPFHCPPSPVLKLPPPAAPPTFK